LTVDFTDLSTGNPTSWSWDFGDGGASTEENPSHIYTDPGTYTVILTASNSCGSDSETRTGYITVNLPNVVYVSPDGSCNGNQPCYTSIQDAIDAAPGVAILKIAEGTYVEDVFMNVPKEITLQGGWDVTFTTRQEDSIVHGKVTLSNQKLIFNKVRIK